MATPLSSPIVTPRVPIVQVDMWSIGQQDPAIALSLNPELAQQAVGQRCEHDLRTHDRPYVPHLLDVHAGSPQRPCEDTHSSSLVVAVSATTSYPIASRQPCEE